jgi:predicted aminopeptidase
MPDPFGKKIVLFWFLLFTVSVSGCQTIQYYGQAIEGQSRLLLKRQPISEITADPDSPELLRKRLSLILAAREFAEDELQLPAANHYLTYVELDRPFVVWNVMAAPEFSLEAKTWCYPFVGCATYRGYFSEKNAHQYADTLKKQGYEVYVGGVTAYSTLGWFDDPVLSTFIRFSEAHSIALIFHELAHQVLYVSDDTAFNESFATFVEQEGLSRWQLATGSSRFLSDYLNRSQRQRLFVGLIMQYRQKLELLYQTDLPPSQKREKKASIFLELRSEFGRLKARQRGLSAYDKWINQPLNNAKISSVVAYHDFVPVFAKMLAGVDGDLKRFYKVCRKLAEKKKDDRHRILKGFGGQEPDQIRTELQVFQLDS